MAVREEVLGSVDYTAVTPELISFKIKILTMVTVYPHHEDATVAVEQVCAPSSQAAQLPVAVICSQFRPFGPLN